MTYERRFEGETTAVHASFLCFYSTGAGNGDKWH